MVKKSFTTLGMSLVLAISVNLWPAQSSFSPQITETTEPTLAVLTENLQTLASLTGHARIPQILSQTDREAYKATFEAQEEGDWKTADAYISQIENPILMGHVLAERYLHDKYSSKPEELAEWLRLYNDHPQAYRIYRLARAKSAASVADIDAIQKPAALSGFGTDSGADLRFSNSGTGSLWHHGLNAWRIGKKKEAADAFAKLAASEKLTPWQSSAAGYWAWRAFNETGEYEKAAEHLKLAANNGYTFYGILARKQLGVPMTDNATPIRLTETDILSMMHKPVFRRVIALAESDARGLADKELRVAFPQAGDVKRLRLLALAHELKLASVQMNMARQFEKKGIAFDKALYPVPYWQPQDGFKVDPALVYALTRQESGFRTSVTSPMGAAGLMQIMPTTASMMKRSLKIETDESMEDPEFNMSLGQNYILHLLNHSMVDHNLIYMLSAYNAGPARLLEWKKRTSQDDPLLFVESIPYGETRAYVMQVMSNYWMYSELMGEYNQTLTLMAKGAWPQYGRPATFAAADASDIKG